MTGTVTSELGALGLPTMRPGRRASGSVFHRLAGVAAFAAALSVSAATADRATSLNDCWGKLTVYVSWEAGAPMKPMSLVEFVQAAGEQGVEVSRVLTDATAPIAPADLALFVEGLSGSALNVATDPPTPIKVNQYPFHPWHPELFAAEVELFRAVVGGQAFLFLHAPPLSEAQRLAVREQIETVLAGVREHSRSAGYDMEVVDKELSLGRTRLGSMMAPGCVGLRLEPLPKESVVQVRDELARVFGSSAPLRSASPTAQREFVRQQIEDIIRVRFTGPTPWRQGEAEAKFQEWSDARMAAGARAFELLHKVEWPAALTTRPTSE